jgi:SH3-like domain-containing protein
MSTSLVSHVPALRSRLFVALLAAALAAGMPGFFALSAMAQSGGNPSGLSLPRFASTRSEPINVRVGPGTEYGIAWIFLKAGQPVEIIQEFDTWRKIRDVDGDEGWMHQSLLSGTRLAFVAPWRQNEAVALLTRESGAAPVRAWLSAGMLVNVDRCNGTWCAVTARGQLAGSEHDSAYSGFLDQAELWGVYQDEEFD